ncbi:MAG: acyl-CoA dehydrogenase family protein [Acidilobaceae archaeon]
MYLSKENRGDVEGIRVSVREFAEKRLRGVARFIDESNSVSEDVLRDVVSMGYFALRVPEDYEGPGLSVFESVIVIEELSRVSSAIGVMATVSGSMVPYSIVRYGSSYLKDRYLRLLAKGGIGAFALTEPCCGSDAAAIMTRAELDGDEFIVNGTKTYITNAPYADFFIVAVRTGRVEDRHKGISLLVVDRGPCVKISKLDMMGYRGSGTSEVKFEDCRVPKENLIGEINTGFKKIMMTLNEGRITTSATALGIMQAAFEEAFRYAQERTSMGVPIIEHQLVQYMISEMAVLLETSRLLLYEAAKRVDSGDLEYIKYASMAKLYVASRGVDLVRMAMQVMGGVGYSKESIIERLYRDIKMVEIGDGTNEIQRLVIVRSLLGKIKPE